MKKSTDTIGHRTRDLLVCSAVPQPTAPPRAPPNVSYITPCIESLHPTYRKMYITADAM
jgi:hypothetical protein